jgi:hypothetical protein
MTYYNAAMISSFTVKLDGDVILKCVQSVDIVREEMSPSSSTVGAINTQDNARAKTCFSAGLFYVPSNGRLSMVNRNRAVLNDSQANFWGFVKLF